MINNGGDYMAVVQEIIEGRCIVRIHDDAYINRTEEEIKETITRCSEIVYQYAKKNHESHNEEL